MRPVLRPGLRLHRDARGRAALVEHDRIYWLDDVTAGLLESLDGLLDEEAVLAGRPRAAAPAWRRLRDGAVVVDAEEAVRPLRTLGREQRAAALPETTALLAQQPKTAAACWQRRRAASVAVCGEGAVTADVVALLQRSGLGQVRAQEQARPQSPEPDVTVLADDHEPAVEVVEALMRSGRAHVPAGFRGADGVVGPFVRPGATACLRCVDLTRAAHDPGWAALRDQLSGGGHAGATVPPTSCVVTAAVSALVVAEVLAHVDGREPAGIGTTLCLSPHRPVPTARSWPVHPTCGCTWHTQMTTRGQWTA